MKRSDVGRQVLANLRAERNVPKSVAVAFFDRLLGLHDDRQDCLATMDQTLASLPEAAFAGPQGDLGRGLLTRFGRLARLADLPVFKRAGIGLQRLLRSPDLADKIKKLPLGNRRGIVWAAANSEVAEAVRLGATTDELLNRLGIQEALVDPMFRVVYTIVDVDAAPMVPTVLDAGADPRFRPSPMGSPHGITNPISAGKEGFPEYVHAKAVVENSRVSFYVGKEIDAVEN